MAPWLWDMTSSAQPKRVVWMLRIVLLLVCLVVSVPLNETLPALVMCGAILLVASVTLLCANESPIARCARGLEAVLTAVAVALTGLGESPFFLYLAAPVLAAGLLSGVVDAIVVTGIGAAALFAVAALGGELDTHKFVVSTVEIIALGMAAGLVAAWTRRLLRVTVAEEEPLYSAALELLTQLRVVTRRLPGTLDPVAATGQLLTELSATTPHDRAGVFVRTGGGRLVPLAGGADALNHWNVSMSADTPFAEAWASQEVQLIARPGRPWLAVLPLLVGMRTTGLVAIEGDGGDPPDERDIAALRAIVTDAALRLETALVFDEIRDLATAEERSRLAREIHDGIAQELVIVGYGIDNALGELPSAADGTRQTLEDLRREVTRIISELRLSLFDLRTDIEPHGGLGAAISAYLQTIGPATGLTVHISLRESAHRLPATVEVELLRIVQEAVTNARKHAGATNLWVSCNLNPPQAVIRVEDDGRGISGPGRRDSFGLSVMQERAERIRAKLDIRPRSGKGTVVEVRLDTSHARTLRSTPHAVSGTGTATGITSGERVSVGGVGDDGSAGR